MQHFPLIFQNRERRENLFDTNQVMIPIKNTLYKSRHIKFQTFYRLNKPHSHIRHRSGNLITPYS